MRTDAAYPRQSSANRNIKSAPRAAGFAAVEDPLFNLKLKYFKLFSTPYKGKERMILSVNQEEHNRMKAESIVIVG
jgi:hypothetical protein